MTIEEANKIILDMNHKYDGLEIMAEKDHLYVSDEDYYSIQINMLFTKDDANKLTEALQTLIDKTWQQRNQSPKRK